MSVIYIYIIIIYTTVVSKQRIMRGHITCIFASNKKGPEPGLFQKNEEDTSVLLSLSKQLHQELEEHNKIQIKA